MSQKDLAKRLNLSLVEVERIEHAEASGGPVGRGLGAGSVTRLKTIPWPNGLVLGSLAALVTIRFFTEVVPVIPRFANFVDVPITAGLVLAATFAGRRVRQTKLDTRLGWAGIAFLALSVAASLTNLTRVDLAPALIFLYGILSPLVVFFAVRRLWVPGYALLASRLVIALGITQLVVVAAIDVPSFLSTRNPDDVSGTFGTNAYQLVFFMLLFIALLIGIYVHERDRAVARFAPLLIVGSLVAIVLAQYRALLLPSMVALLLAALLVGGARGRRVVRAAIVLSAFVGVLAYVAQNVPAIKIEETSKLSLVDLASTRLDVLDQLDRLYTDEPRFALTGTGPGTYSSRGWQTFAQAGSDSESNVQGGYATALTGGEIYHTDVSDKYVSPMLRGSKAISGSYAVTTPLAEYVAVVAEVGVPGLIVVLVIYGSAFVAAVRTTMVAAGRAVPGDPVPALLLSASVGLAVLLQMGVLQNWLEVTRLTFPTWMLLAIAITEHLAKEPKRR